MQPAGCLIISKGSLHSQAPVCANQCQSECIQQIIVNIADRREKPGRLRTVANLKAVKVKFIKETTNY